MPAVVVALNVMGVPTGSRKVCNFAQDQFSTVLSMLVVIERGATL